MFLSIIIPAYNSQETIIPLLESIAQSRKVNFKEIEIIIIDDCSTDNTVEKILQLISPPRRSLSNPFTPEESWRIGVRPLGRLRSDPKPPPGVFLAHFKIIQLKRNSGPAQARNIGVKYAKGQVVLFFDSDVVVYKNTLFEVVRSFKEDPDLYALTGVWDKKQRNNRFFPKFKALRDWSYWINERDPRNYYYLFSTRVAAIRRDLFLRLGGFDTTYKAALVEDIELTYRIAKRYAVVFNPKVIVHHEFEDFLPIAKKYFWRSYFWSKIYRARKKFDPVATTGKEALTTISAGGVAGVGFLTLLSHLSNLNHLSNLLDMTLGVTLLIHLFGVRKFLFFVAREEDLVFAIKSFFTGLILYLVILAGAAASLLINSKSKSKN